MQVFLHTPQRDGWSEHGILSSVTKEGACRGWMTLEFDLVHRGEGRTHMNIWNWFRSRISDRSKALLLYHRGMTRAKHQDHAGAFDDYTATISMHGVPPDIKAMALFNRALVLAADGDNLRALEDLKMVLSIPETADEVRTETRRKLVRMERKSSKNHDDTCPLPCTAEGRSDTSLHSAAIRKHSN